MVFIFALINDHSALAQNLKKTSWEIWDDNDYIYIDGHGSIIKSNLFAITLDKKNCDKLDVELYISSLKGQHALEGQEFIIEITETYYETEQIDEYKNEVFIKYSEKNGDHIIYVLSFYDSFKTENWLNSFNDFGPSSFFINIVEHADDSSQNPSNYFNHTSYLWDLSGLNSVLHNAYMKCRFFGTNLSEV